jgi:hypothetical protein
MFIFRISRPKSPNSPRSAVPTIFACLLYKFRTCLLSNRYVQASWNVMAHAQKPYFVFRRNGRVHLNRWERQFSRLRAADMCASAVVMLDTPCSEVVWRYWLPTLFSSFPFTSPSVRHRVPSHFNWSLPRVLPSQCKGELSMLIIHVHPAPPFHKILPWSAAK